MTRTLMMCAVCEACGFAFSAEYADAGNPCPLCKPLSKKRQRKSAPLGEPETEAPAAIGWRCWREMYAASRRRYGCYTEGLEDGKIMASLCSHAARLAGEEAEKASTGEQWTAAAVLGQYTEQLLRWWFSAFLRDDGSRTFSLADQRHSLRFITKSLPTYGVPWGRPQAPRQAQPRLEDLPAKMAAPQDPDASIAVPAALRSALANVGRSVAPVRRRP